MDVIFKVIKCLNDWDDGKFVLIPKSALKDDFELKYNDKKIVSGSDRKSVV